MCAQPRTSRETLSIACLGWSYSTGYGSIGRLIVVNGYKGTDVRAGVSFYMSALTPTMESDPNILNDIHNSYRSLSDPEDDDSASEVQSLDAYDMLDLVDNPDEIIFSRSEINDIVPITDDDAWASEDDVIFLERNPEDQAEAPPAETSLHVIQCLDSDHCPETSSLGLVCHLSYQYIPDC